MDNRAPGITRRQVLRGAGGFTLAIPFLPSLFPRSAKAATASRPRLFWFGTDHGGCWDGNFFPDTAMLTSKAASAPGHMVASGPLTATTANGRTTLSPVLNASSTMLSSRLVGKMNVLRGLDVPWYIAHNTGLHLGNFARNDNNGDCGAAVTALGNRPTIDQIMANSSSFYTSADLSGVKLRTMIVDSGRALSWAFSNPAQGVASPVQNVQGVNSSQQVSTSLFGGSSTATNPRPPVVDKILANYNSLRQSNTRLSAADKTRLDAHIAMVAQLQSSLGARLSCTTPTAPTDDADKHDRTHSKADAAAHGQLWADLVVAAFSCGASRIGVLGWGDTSGFSDYVGTDWHHDVAHQWMSAQPQAWLTQSYQGFFEQVFLYLAGKLDQVDDGMGGTLLDSTLLVWSQESGMETHEAYGVPVVTCGAGAGFFKTGLYCDYRNVGETGGTIAPEAPSGYKTYAGLLYSQWLATVLQGMGVPPSEFELWKDSSGNVQKGYGTPYFGSDFTPSNAWKVHYKSISSPYYTTASTVLPFLKA